ncbi:MAG TPA: hypothetical protein VJY62_20555 [Bacteroidia bacterium]|nr:hypothetical protein [Bacteroidia bacterium]
MIESICIVVRSAGERTTEGCVSLLKKIFPAKNIHLLQVVPFSKAVKEALEIGIKEKKEWLLCIDADVLVSEQGVHQLLERANEADFNVFRILGLVHDKFFSVYRAAGNHLYRIEFAQKAISMIPGEGTSLRPETEMNNRMSEEGYPWMRFDTIVGLHDYEQYYADIYRKCFLHAHKHQYLLADLENYWSKMVSSDPDFQVALWGAASGKDFTEKVFVDKRFLEKEAQNILSVKQFKEKEPLNEKTDLAEYVQNKLDLYAKQNDFSFQEKIFPEKSWNKTSPGNYKKKNSVNTKKNIMQTFNKAGGIFVKIANKLQYIYKSL